MNCLCIMNIYSCQFPRCIHCTLDIGLLFKGPGFQSTLYYNQPFTHNAVMVVNCSAATAALRQTDRTKAAIQMSSTDHHQQAKWLKSLANEDNWHREWGFE